MDGTPEQHGPNAFARPNNPAFQLVRSGNAAHEHGEAIGLLARPDEAAVPNLEDIYPRFRADPPSLYVPGVKEFDSAQTGMRSRSFQLDTGAAQNRLPFPDLLPNEGGKVSRG